MDTNKLRHFRAVVETGHLRKAAALLGMTPGAISKSLKKFSQEIGKELIRPLGRGISITNEGRSVYHHSHEIIGQLDLFYGRLRQEQNQEREVRVASFEVFSSVFMAEFLAIERPAQRLRLLELSPSVIENAILKNEIDYGITYAPFPSPELDHLKIKNFKMKVFALKPESWNKSPLSTWPFAIPTTALAMNPGNLDSLDNWPVRLIPRTVRYRFELLQTALETASRGLAVVYCPEFVVRLFNRTRQPGFQLKEVALPKAFKGDSLSVYLVKRSCDVESPFLKKLAKFIRSTI